MTETKFWVGLCREHHNWIGNHPLEARELGLLCEAGKWNLPEHVRD